MSSSSPSPSHWAVRAVDKLMRDLENKRYEGSEIICASGVSPSGTIHLGNLREVMTTHLIVEELRRRGEKAKHIHSWDDYDRLRKIPSGLPESFRDHIGKPLCEVPDPDGVFESFADRNIMTFMGFMDRLGVEFTPIRQGSAYKSLRYTREIETAMAARGQIFDILDRYRTKVEGEDLVARRAAYYPFKTYCEECGRDSTQVTHYEIDTAIVHYGCSCGHLGNYSLRIKCHGKLVWKVDWPMRWALEGVDFEPGGEDHATKGSSYCVGSDVVKEVFGGKPPSFIMYGFVGAMGMEKISSSTGTEMTPANALEVFEPAMLRWLYLRRESTQKFSLDFGTEVLRTYDEWDGLLDRRASGTLTSLDSYCLERSVSTSTKEVAATEVRVPFRLLSAATDMTQGHLGQIVRIAQAHLEGHRELSAEELQPRLTCAHNWALKYQDDDSRTTVREEFALDVWHSLPDLHKQGIPMILDLVPETSWELDELTRALYGVPKLLLGLPIDLKKPTSELKTLQRAFFASIYLLMVSRDTGPRIPTLFIGVGRERTMKLLTPSAK